MKSLVFPALVLMVTPTALAHHTTGGESGGFRHFSDPEVAELQDSIRQTEEYLFQLVLRQKEKAEEASATALAAEKTIGELQTGLLKERAETLKAVKAADKAETTLARLQWVLATAFSTIGACAATLGIRKSWLELRDQRNQKEKAIFERPG
jgi:hypothetical protein